MKQLLKNLYGLLVNEINDHDKRLKKMELQFPEIAAYVAKKTVTIEEVKDLVTKEHEAANADSAAALAALSADLLAKAQAYADSGNAQQDSAMAEVVSYLKKAGNQLNVIGGTIGTPVPVAPAELAPTPVEPVISAPIEPTAIVVPVEPPVDPAVTPTETPV